MEIQQYILENKKDFNLKHIFECGQCFRWNISNNGNYIGTIKNAVIEVIEKDNKIIFQGVSNNKLEDIVKEYFNLDLDYGLIKNNLSSIDNFLKNSITYGSGIRILKQDVFETIISFIISANNNIPRIKKIIENISRAYGDKISYKDQDFYLFPTSKQLAKASIEDLRNLGLGFRDKRVYTTNKMILDNVIDIENLIKEKNTEKLRDELLKLDGVGPKVADCILLFAFNRYEVFPIDVWVRRVMNELYIKNIEESKVRPKEVLNLAREKYGNLAGIAQQYLFYWKRETSK